MRALRLSSLRQQSRRLRSVFYFRSYKQLWRGLARFTRECEHDSLVTTFYPCRHAMPYTRVLYAPKRAR